MAGAQHRALHRLPLSKYEMKSLKMCVTSISHSHLSMKLTYHCPPLSVVDILGFSPCGIKKLVQEASITRREKRKRGVSFQGKDQFTPWVPASGREVLCLCI